MTTAQAIVDRSRVTLIDDAKITWSDADLLAYLNMGIAQACGSLLILYVLTEMAALAAGPRQALPAGGLLLLDIPRNQAGDTVKQAHASEFAKTRPNWPQETPSANPRYFLYDRRAPLSFMVYPPATAGAQVELVYGATPDPVALGDTIPISTAFDTALWAYVIGMAYTKNTKRQDVQQSKAFMDMYGSMLGTWKQGVGEMSSQPDPKGVY
jgi:hypothetical protein